MRCFLYPFLLLILKRKVEADPREFAPALVLVQARVGLLDAAMRTCLRFEPPCSYRTQILHYVLRAILVGPSK